MGMREELSKPLIIYMIKKTGFGFLLDGEDDFIHDVYVECLSKEKHWKKDIPLATFVATQIKNVRARPFKTKKGKAEVLASRVDMEGIAPATVKGDMEDKVLLEELKEHMGLEMKYWLHNPRTPDYSSTSITRRGKVPVSLDMSFAYLGEVLGLCESRVHYLISENKKRMRELV